MSRSSKRKSPLRAGLALERVLGRLVGGRGEVGVAQAAAAAARHHQPLAGRHEIRQQLPVRTEDDGARRHGQVQVRAGLAVAT